MNKQEAIKWAEDFRSNFSANKSDLKELELADKSLQTLIDIASKPALEPIDEEKVAIIFIRDMQEAIIAIPDGKVFEQLGNVVSKTLSKSSATVCNKFGRPKIDEGKILKLFDVPNFDLVFENIPEQAKKDLAHAIKQELER